MDKLLEILHKIKGSVDFSKEEQLCTDGLLDSMNIVELVAELEEQFAIAVPFREITKKNFESAARIWAMVERLQGNTGIMQKPGGSLSEHKMFDSILEAIKYYAEATPKALCLAEESKTVSYGQYWDLIKRLAMVFKGKGIKKRDRVVVEANQTILYLAVGHAVNLAGAVWVPAVHGCGENRLRYLAGNFESRVVIANGELKMGGGSDITYLRGIACGSEESRKRSG